MENILENVFNPTNMRNGLPLLEVTEGRQELESILTSFYKSAKQMLPGRQCAWCHKVAADPDCWVMTTSWPDITLS